MDCRICGIKCENSDPRFQQLCRICGSKREAYICALISGPQRSSLGINELFDLAEKIVKRDRDANS